MAVFPSRITVRAPGRINLIGEHTDYNEGWVLPAAIDRYMTVTAWTNPSSQDCHLTALDVQESYTFSLNDLPHRPGSWTNHVIGVLAELQKKGFRLQGFSATLTGNIPIGGGLSSSAALENAVGMAVNELFQLGLSPMDLVQVSQNAEHHFVGTHCGIMDMFTSMLGREQQVILLDCRSLEYTYHPLFLDSYALLLMNTQVSHALAETEYNTRRQECVSAVSILRKHDPTLQSLRDVSVDQLPEVLSYLPEPLQPRCRHVVLENARVLRTVAALQRGDWPQVGRLLYDSHDSLRKDYAVSCPELDFLVDQTRSDDRVLGSRMMGGGFGGCTLNLVKREAITDLVASWTDAYAQTFGYPPEAYTVRAVGGTEVLP